MNGGRWLNFGLIGLGGVIIVGGYAWERWHLAPASPPAVELAVATAPDGEALYQANCASCHMVDGWGVPNFQPGIVEGPIVAAGAERVAAVIRGGSAALRDRENPMGWEMPPFGFMSQPEIDALTAYVVTAFGPEAQQGED